MKKNLIISSGIVFIMLILSTLTLFTHTIKTPAFVIGYIFLDIAIVLQIIPWGVLKFKNNLEFLRVPYIIVYGVYLIIQFILFKTVIIIRNSKHSQHRTLVSQLDSSHR